MEKSIGTNKVFGIGLNKTGTSTLGQCGALLGYRATGVQRKLLEDIVLHNDYTRVIKHVSKHDLFEDWPWPLIYQKLDEMFPGSKFVLTVRKDEKAWYESLKKHSMKSPPLKHCRKLAFGYTYPHKYESELCEFYRRHNSEVREYFANRENDFIEICWEAGDGFEKLCDFLGKEVPDIPIPHANRGSVEKVRLRRIWMNRILCAVS